MYGLLIGALQHFVENSYGTDVWLKALNVADIDYQSFQTKTVYAESIISRIVVAISELTNESEDDIMFNNGYYFVEFMSTCGYDKILRVLGRNFIDFIQGLDNLHEYLRFSYPKIKPPSFNVEIINTNELKLHYRTRRPGYQHYVRGQLVNIAKFFYQQEIRINVVSQTKDVYQTHYAFELYVNNESFKSLKSSVLPYNNFPVPRNIFFEIFPFHLLLNQELIIEHCGMGFKYICPTLNNSNFNDEFIISKPFIDSTYENVIDLFITY